MLGCTDEQQGQQYQTGCLEGSDSTTENVYLPPSPSDTVPPFLSGSTPKSGAQIGANDDIILSFSETVKVLNNSTVTLADSTGTAIALTITGSGNYYTVTPDSTLSSTNYILTISTGVTDNAENDYTSSTIVFSISSSGSSGGQLINFVLTTGADSPDGTVMDLAKENTFIATESTLSSADKLDGGDGDDYLRYASAGGAAVTENGFEATSIETIQITSDAVGGTTFDVAGVSGLTLVRNFNSSRDHTITGLSTLTPLTIQSVSGGDTTFDYDAMWLQVLLMSRP